MVEAAAAVPHWALEMSPSGLMNESGSKNGTDAITWVISSRGNKTRARSELFTNAGFVLNEGGYNETIVDHVSFWGIEVQAKVPLWLRITMKGVAGKKLGRLGLVVSPR